MLAKYTGDPIISPSAHVIFLMQALTPSLSPKTHSPRFFKARAHAVQPLSLSPNEELGFDLVFFPS
jgi:hypothetical protein